VRDGTHETLNHRELVEILFSSCYMGIVSVGMITILATGATGIYRRSDIGGMVAFYSYMGGYLILCVLR